MAKKQSGSWAIEASASPAGFPIGAYVRSAWGGIREPAGERRPSSTPPWRPTEVLPGKKQKTTVQGTSISSQGFSGVETEGASASSQGLPAGRVSAAPDASRELEVMYTKSCDLALFGSCYYGYLPRLVDICGRMNSWLAPVPGCRVVVGVLWSHREAYKELLPLVRFGQDETLASNLFLHWHVSVAGGDRRFPLNCMETVTASETMCQWCLSGGNDSDGECSCRRYCANAAVG